jgi:nucleotide-binding universal stress UspA family protein
MNGHRILVPTDMTEFGGAALNYARLFRDNLGSRVTVLFADTPIYAAGMPDVAFYADMERSQEDRERLTQRLNDHVREHLAPPFDARILRQFPVAAIEQTAEEIDASLIIMGTHGRSGWRRLLQGSIAEQIVHRATRPILTVGIGAVPGRQPLIETILCPVNLSPVALAAFREAAAMTAMFGARLIAVYVAEPEETFPPYLKSRLASLIEPVFQDKFAYERVVRTGNAAERILETAEEVHADLLVIGAQHKRFRDETVIGSTTGRLIRFASCPVMTFIRPADVVKAETAAA